MDRKNFLDNKYKEFNRLKNMMAIYPKEYLETIVKVMEQVSSDVSIYLKTEKEKNINRGDEKIFTLQQLALYNGLNGMEAYVAINGIVYDVTNVKTWSGGRHFGIGAGKDLTTYFNTCHKKDIHILSDFPIVGKLKQD